MRSAGAFDGVVHLGRIEVKFICHLEIGGVSRLSTRA
jgi:hypothetical protein